MTPKKIQKIMDDYAMMMNALSAFGNQLTNNANVIMASQTSREDRKFSERMSNLAWERNLEAWRMQNDYNLPANQYARQLEGLQANGLNPNLVYGNSSAVTGAASTPSPYKFDGYHSTAVPQFRGMDPIQNILSTRLLQTQVAAQEANNRLVNARADNEEARLPGLSAKSNEAAYRWNYIESNIADSYEAGIRAQVATDYWKGVQTEYNAHYAKDRSTIQYYEAIMAEWLNTTLVPGTDYTYQQYMERYKSMLPAQTFANLKASTLNFASQIAFRKKQGELIDLKSEYQTYVNKFARDGRAIGNDWFTTLLSGLMELFGTDTVASTFGETLKTGPLGSLYRWIDEHYPDLNLP